MEEKGVVFRLSEQVTRIEGEGKAERVVTDKGAIEADLVIVSVGVTPNDALAKAAGLAVSERGGVIVDEYMAACLDNVTKTFTAMGSNSFDHDMPDDPLLQLDDLRREIRDQEAGLKKRLSMDEAMLSNIITPMAIIDTAGNIKWLNEYMVRLTENEGRPEKHIGTHFSQFFYGDLRETVAEKAVKIREKQSSKTEFTTHKGKLKYISVFSTPIMWP